MPPVRAQESGLDGSSGPIVMDRAIARCVRLQTFLYFSFWFDLLFAFIEVLAGWAKWRWIKGATIVALFCANYVLCFILEPCRLYLGYAGNLGERVPELFLFVFMCLSCLSLLIAELVLCYIMPSLQPENCSLVSGLPCVLPVEQACWIVRIVLLLGELFLGVRALRRLIHEQSARFFVALDASEGDASRLDDSMDQDADLSAHWAASNRRGSAAQTPERRTSRVAGSPETLREGQSLRQDESGVRAQIFGRQTSPVRRPHAD
eukprot:gb/GFBE01022379.1/.p1 GENE.gb/GFBE01022379.1/~~gb/GFBE01022379.1/.p1  ORF type:complete len:263 (+),score=45.41 gb/GFBE01022379.1/:1-789(+)